MTLINQVLAEDVNVSGLLNSSANPATKIKDVSIAGLLGGKGLDVINFVFIIIGLLFFANLIMSGWDYMLSSGDPKKVQGATTRLVNGLIGLIMAVLAFVIVRLVTNVLGLGTLV